MSDLILRGEIVTDLPNKVVKDSAASRKADVSIALPLLGSGWTSTKDFLRVSNQVPPAGYVEVEVEVEAIISVV